MAQRSGLNSRVCQWIGQGDALRHFATYSGSTQSQQHIKPPTADSPLHLNRFFFGTLYRRFDETLRVRGAGSEVRNQAA